MTQTSPAAARQLDAIPVHRKSLSQRLRENWQLYVMLLIPVVLTIVYKYWPMYGIQIAFRDFKASRGITGSEWVGLYWFERFFTAPNCVRMIKNTVLLSLYSLLWSFPIPIILSLCINQLRFAKFKRVVQTVLYAPHFISTMVICGMIKIFLSPSGWSAEPDPGHQRRTSSRRAPHSVPFMWPPASGRKLAGARSFIWRVWLLWIPACTKPPRSTARPCSSASCILIFRSWYP